MKSTYEHNEQAPRMSARRRALAIGLLGATVGLAGCGEQSSATPESTPSASTEVTPLATPTPSEITPTATSEPTPAPTEAFTPAPVPTSAELPASTPGPTPNPVESETPAPAPKPEPVPIETEPSVEQEPSAEILAGTMDAFVERYDHLRDIGMVVYDWETGERYAHNEHVPFVSASLFKAYVAYGVLHEVDAGQISLDETLPIDPKGNHDIFIPQEGMTVRQCLERMITISSNTCGSALNARVGWANLDTLLDEAGFSGTEMNPYRNGPQYTDRLTTAHDVSNLFLGLYNGELLSPESSDIFITHLRNQQLGYALPTGLEYGMTLDHKPGLLPSADGRYSHDAGVIYGYESQLKATLLTLDKKEQSPEIFTQFGQSIVQYLRQK